jgi:hypothetical protein
MDIDIQETIQALKTASVAYKQCGPLLIPIDPQQAISQLEVLQAQKKSTTSKQSPTTD